MQPTNDPEHDQDDSEIQRQNIVALVFVAVLAVFGIWLVHAYRTHLMLQTCFESGRRNCAPLELEKDRQ